MRHGNLVRKLSCVGRGSALDHCYECFLEPYVAKKIIEYAKCGERDAARLREDALKELQDNR
jgi:hypothetical protein